MAALIWDDVVAFAPKLDTIDPGAQEDILDHVNISLDPGAFGGEDAAKLRLARINLAAHIGTMLQRGVGGGGQITSEEAGGLKRTYAVSQAAVDGSGLEATAFGQEFKALVRSSLARLPFVV